MKKTVLLVDDTASIRSLVSATLEEAGYRVLAGVDGVDGLRHLDGQPIDLVITDLNMPNMDGIELIRQIRVHNGYPHIPILLFSTESAEVKQKAREAGATGMIEKPMMKENMLVQVRRLVR